MLLAVMLAAAAAAEPQVREFVARDAGLAVAMPGTPDRKVHATQTPDGPSRSVSYDLKHDGCGYFAQRVTLPARHAQAGPEAILARQRDNIRTKNERSGGTVLAETSVTLGPHSGIEILQAPWPRGTARLRSYAVGGDMVTVSFIKYPGCQASEQTEMQFLDSLRLRTPGE